MKRQIKILRMVTENLNKRDKTLAGLSALSLAALAGSAVGPKTRKTMMGASFVMMVGTAIPVIYELISGVIKSQDVIFFDEYVDTEDFEEDE